MRLLVEGGHSGEWGLTVVNKRGLVENWILTGKIHVAELISVRSVDQ